ncbi:ADP-ribosyl cyclase/cyclic ADP-ribose hydrolase 1-like isoform X1 [Trematomus bernacchii]|uniref:ADP-ribosyl cyclase/cyclic ADP-ribose hydrolase 1-like isoform X1 n=1 Tax=Trematomus bernacchii TaxID=40690 RepID=UPI00146DE464|nr:ADP-ribosyl cyclase/cyclic ADP-ribose hydrolase 1-like isoform X1 [Trematomus bernacchii]
MEKKHCITVTVVIALVIVVVAVVLGITLGKRTFKQEFEYRCSKFESSKKYNCTEIWHEFEKAYVNQDPCKIPMNAYDSLVAAAPFEHACNKTLFWSKTKNLVHDLTKNRDDVNLEKTLLGSVLDGVTSWCGKMGSSETLTEGCPVWTKCENNPPRLFWNRLSTAFADFACENVTVILDGSIDTPFNPTTTFATIEVKRIKYPKVKSLTVVIVPQNSTCNSDSLKALKSALVQGITYNCKEVTEAKIKKCSSDPKTPIGKCW